MSSTASGNGSLKQIWTKFWDDYKRNQTKKLLMVDSLMAYAIATAIVQLVYMALVGSFPFNSFLSSFFCHLGLFALAVSLRLQLTSSSQFSGIVPEKAFGDFALCAIVLLFVVFSFLG